MRMRLCPSPPESAGLPSSVRSPPRQPPAPTTPAAPHRPPPHPPPGDGPHGSAPTHPTRRLLRPRRRPCPCPDQPPSPRPRSRTPARPRRTGARARRTGTRTHRRPAPPRPGRHQPRDRRTARGRRTGPGGRRPGPGPPGPGLRPVPQQRPAPPAAAAGRDRPPCRPGGRGAVRPRRSASPTSPTWTPTSPGSTPGEPLGERITVSGRLLDRDRPPRARPARRDLAGQRLRPVRPPARPAPGPARPQLHRRRPLSDRRRGPLRVHHRQARRLPVAQPPQRLAPGPHPLLALRHGVHPAAGHPDVLPRRPALPLRPDPRSVTDAAARARLVAAYDHELSRPEWSLGYRWDIVLDGPSATWIEEGR